MWRKLFCYVQQVLYCCVSETAPDTQCMRSWTDLEQMWILWKGEKSLENYFTVYLVCSVRPIQIVPGMHMVIFIRTVEKDNVCYWEKHHADKEVKKENVFQ
jgi:hypothetical protein